MLPRTVLHIQHAGSLGGSCTSLVYMLERIDRARFRPVVALTRPAPAVARFHRDAGLEVIEWPGIETFEHTTAHYTSALRPATWETLARTLVGWRRSERRTLALVRAVRPDLVHLNSAVQVPSARALRAAGVPFVWHVREMPPPGLPGLRRALQHRALGRWPGETIFLSEVERRAWLGDGKGRVVPEFVDPARFDRAMDGTEARRELKVPEDAKVVLYMGGMSALKGVHVLLEALALARRREPRLLCLMPGAEPLVPAPGALARLAAALWNLAGARTPTQRLEGAFDEHGVADACRRLPFTGEMPRLLAASDLLAFPSTLDHFSRPAVEAGVMGKPVVASRFPMVEEQVHHGETGLLVPPGDPVALSEALLAMLSDPIRARAMGAAGRALALQRFDASRNAEAVMRIYDEVLARTTHAGDAP